ncbi:hypothetical protein Hamer_G008455 [Homarus americanus]|uniref:Uncharacterized protein n=1 Tax=Homarus americanus TaxID=6706 RepID=A0A8J5N3Z9_HOMAM|nr:hypothetical protein Hamer_G008455 [Homarus americanus]
MERTICCSGTAFRCDLPDQRKKEGSAEGSPCQSSVAVTWTRAVHLGRLRSSHLPPTRTRSKILEEPQVDLGNSTMDQEEEHRPLLTEVDVTGEGYHSEDVTEVDAPRVDSEDIPAMSHVRASCGIERPGRRRATYLL